MYEQAVSFILSFYSGHILKVSIAYLVTAFLLARSVDLISRLIYKQVYGRESYREVRELQERLADESDSTTMLDRAYLKLKGWMS